MMNRLLFLSGILLASLMMADLANGMQGNGAKGDDTGGVQHPLAEVGQNGGDEDDDEQVTPPVVSGSEPKDIIASVSDEELSDATTHSSVVGETKKPKKRRVPRKKDTTLEEKGKKTATPRKQGSKVAKTKDDVLESDEGGGSDLEEDQGDKEPQPVDSSTAQSEDGKKDIVEPIIRQTRHRIITVNPSKKGTGDDKKRKGAKTRQTENAHKPKTPVKEGDSESGSDKEEEQIESVNDEDAQGENNQEENDQKGDQKTGVVEGESGASESESEADSSSKEKNEQHKDDVASLGDKKKPFDQKHIPPFPESVFDSDEAKQLSQSERKEVRVQFKQYFDSLDFIAEIDQTGEEKSEKEIENIAGNVVKKVLEEKNYNALEISKGDSKKHEPKKKEQKTKQVTTNPAAKMPLTRQTISDLLEQPDDDSPIVKPDEGDEQDQTNEIISLPDLAKPYYPEGEDVDVGWMKWFLSAPVKLKEVLAYRLFSYKPNFTQKISVNGQKPRDNSYLPDLGNPGRFYIVNPKGEMGRKREGNLVIQLDVISEGTEEQRDERLKRMGATFYLVPGKRQRRLVIDPNKYLVMTMAADFSSFNTEAEVVNPEVVITLAGPEGAPSDPLIPEEPIRIKVGDDNFATNLAMGNLIHQRVSSYPGGEKLNPPYVLWPGMSTSLGQEQGVYAWFTPEELAVLFDKYSALKKKFLALKADGKKTPKTKKKRTDKEQEQDPQEELIKQFEEQIQQLLVIASVNRDKEAEIFIKDDEVPPKNWVPAKISARSWPLELWPTE